MVDRFFVNLGFNHCEFDHRTYVLHVHGDTLIVVVYVVDLILTGNKPNIIFTLKSQLATTFEMTYLSIQHFFLGLQVSPFSDGPFISQSKYVLDLLKHFKMANCKACVMPFQSSLKLTRYYQSPQVNVALYHWMVSSLIYLTHSRLDISFFVIVVSCFM